MAQTAGNLNVVAVGWNDTTSTVNSVTDTAATPTPRPERPTTGTGLRQAIYYAKNIAAGSNTVTVTFNQAAAFVDVRVLEYSGLDTASPLDVTAGAVGHRHHSQQRSGHDQLGQRTDLRRGYDRKSLQRSRSRLHLPIITNPGRRHRGRQMVSATGSYSAVGAFSYSSAWVMQMATFRASGRVGQSGADGDFDYAQQRDGERRNAVTITGTGFLAGATVKLGGTAATGVTRSEQHFDHGDHAGHAAGAVNVVVTNTDARAGR